MNSDPPHPVSALDGNTMTKPQNKRRQQRSDANSHHPRSQVMLPGSRLSRKQLLNYGLAEEENPHRRPDGEIPEVISQDAFHGARLHVGSLTNRGFESVGSAAAPPPAR